MQLCQDHQAQYDYPGLSSRNCSQPLIHITSKKPGNPLQMVAVYFLILSIYKLTFNEKVINLGCGRETPPELKNSGSCPLSLSLSE